LAGIKLKELNDPMNGAQLMIGAFVLDCEAMELCREGQKVPIGGRACRILHALALQPGHVVSVPALMEAAWPGLQVEDVNLRVQISALRKALGEGTGEDPSIKTIPREGYVLVLPRSPEELSRTRGPWKTLAVPRLLNPLIGRSCELNDLSTLLTRHRIVTITGSAGIGKTSLALAAAARWMEDGEASVFVDLAVPMTSADVPDKVFAALEIDDRPQDLTAGIVRALRSEKLLLVLDNCEHILDGVAAMAQALAAGTAEVTVLATSRESLDVSGEHVFVLDPLPYAPAGARLSADTARTFPAIELFVTSARARGQMFPIHDGNASQVAEICRRLDGIPLAIQLAAASCSVMTVGELARGLDNRFTLLNRGERTSLPQHRTLRAALDWGFDLLSADEVIVFRGLGIFRNPFTMSDAEQVVGIGLSGATPFADLVAMLVAKSLVAVDVNVEPAKLRLLETTREYALMKLEESGDRTRLAERHAHNIMDRLLSAQGASTKEKKAVFASLVDDWRGAHDYALETRQRSLALTLLRQAIAMSELKMGPEFATRVDATFESCGQSVTPEENRDELVIRLFYSNTIAHGINIDLLSMYERVKSCSQRALEIARAHALLPEQLEALWTLIFSATGRSDMVDLRRSVDYFSATASQLDDSSALLSSLRLQGVAAYWSGHFLPALEFLDAAIVTFERVGAPNLIHGFAHLPSALTMRALTHWSLGNFDTAHADVALAGKIAEEIDHAPTVRWVHLVGSIPIAVWCGDWYRARELRNAIDALAVEYSNPGWSRDMNYWETAICALENNFGSYDSRQIAWDSPTPWQSDIQTSMHCGFHRPADLARIQNSPDLWCAAEHYRAAGEQLTAAGYANAEATERLFLTALEVSERQRAMAWEIRARISLARHYQTVGKTKQSASMLHPIVERFAKDSLNPDVRLAWDML
tara:strand:+ start:2733 stop:5531 length:2799 start_codon:yes stop_codon:yes gene_type:complete